MRPLVRRQPGRALEHYLSHEEERARIARAGHQRVQQHTFGSLLLEALGRLQPDWQLLQEKTQKRSQGPAPGPSLTGRVWELLAGSGPVDLALLTELQVALHREPRRAELHYLLGLVLARQLGRTQPARDAAVELLRRLDRMEMGQASVVGVPALAGLGCPGPAKAGTPTPGPGCPGPAKAGTPADTALDLPRVPLEYDHFGVEWERTGWDHAGQPRQQRPARFTLLRWRLHELLAGLTGQLEHFQEAALLRPDLPKTRAALGCAQARQHRADLAVPHLRFAVQHNPFDLQAAQAHYQTLIDSGDQNGAALLARDREQLHAAAPGLVPEEKWAREAPPLGNELASIIILCCNQDQVTRQCLESLLRHTRTPYELILVDNASSDGTARLLRDFQGRPGPQRVEIITNEHNAGFAQGCNQGSERAQGRFLVFLNNDTIVTEGWLEGLIAWSLHEWPKTALVGPVTNYSREPQQINASYTNIEEMHVFAAHRRKEFQRKAQRVDRLSGFCLLTRSEVLRQLGGFDENYGVGFFEDDDLSVRALESGGQLLLALNVFVHHHGSQTFKGLGLDTDRQLARNFEIFQRKWGEKHSRGYRRPDSPLFDSSRTALPSRPDGSGEPSYRTAQPEPAPVPLAHNPSRQTVALCEIVKNEEKNLRDCIGPVRDLFNKVVVLDTGSTDRTREIARELGAEVHEFAWCQDFSAARNESIKYAGTDWIFWLDADDRVDPVNKEKLRQLFASLDVRNLGFAMKCRCLCDPRQGVPTVVDHVRLFRNDPRNRWEFRVHEQIVPSIRNSGGTICFVEVEIVHVGYMDPELRRRKLDRDLELLKLERHEKQDHPFTLFNLGMVYRELKEPQVALPLLQASLKKSQPQDSIVRKLYSLIAACHRELDQPRQARQAYQRCPGRCPGLSCCAPSGRKTRSFAPKGRNRIAQGIALG